MPLDVGVGILLAISCRALFNVPLTASLVLWSIGFALLPDIDVFPELIQRKGKLGGKEIGLHRELAHFPLTYLIPAVIIFYFVGPPWGYLFLCGVLLHLLHDSVGMGWGIKWLWPFSQNSYKFFADRENNMAWQPLIVWKPEALGAAVREYGKPDWFRRYYLELHPIVLIEIGVLLFAIGMLVLKF